MINFSRVKKCSKALRLYETELIFAGLRLFRGSSQRGSEGVETVFCYSQIYDDTNAYLREHLHVNSINM